MRVTSRDKETPRGEPAKLARASTVALLLALGSLAAVCSGAAADAHGVRARADRVQTVKDSAHLYLASADGNTLIEKGTVSGTLAGTVEVSLTLGEHSARSSFTIRTKGGTISGRGSGKLSVGKGGYDSFGGSGAIVGGSGRFRGAKGNGGLYGSIYRVDDTLSVQVTATLRY